jgi:hypothetical protein
LALAVTLVNHELSWSGLKNIPAGLENPAGIFFALAARPQK